AARADVHDVNVIVAGRTAPTEGDEFAVRRPGGIDEIALVREIEFGGVGAVGVHEIELGNAAAIADIYDGLCGLGVPSGGDVGDISVRECKALRTQAIGVDDVDFRIALHGG